MLLRTIYLNVTDYNETLLMKEGIKTQVIKQTMTEHLMRKDHVNGETE